MKSNSTKIIEDTIAIIKSLSPEAVMNSLTQEQKNYIYEEQRKELIRQDTIVHCEANNIPYDDDLIEFVAQEWSEGKYDCNLSYWDNIMFHILEYKQQKKGQTTC